MGSRSCRRTGGRSSSSAARSGRTTRSSKPFASLGLSDDVAVHRVPLGRGLLEAGAGRRRRREPAFPDGGRDFGGRLPARRLGPARRRQRRRLVPRASGRASPRRSRSGKARPRPSPRELGALASDEALREKRSAAAKVWGEARSPQRIAESYARVVRAVIGGRAPSLGVLGRLSREIAAVGAGRAGALGARDRGPDGRAPRRGRGPVRGRPAGAARRLHGEPGKLKSSTDPSGTAPPTRSACRRTARERSEPAGIPPMSPGSPASFSSREGEETDRGLVAALPDVDSRGRDLDQALEAAAVGARGPDPGGLPLLVRVEIAPLAEGRETSCEALRVGRRERAQAFGRVERIRTISATST